jgi:uncharacterized Zn-finger protein
MTHTNPALLAYLNTLPKGRTPPEIIYVADDTVACDGGKVGHPRVYLTIDQKKGFVVCPYCGCIYVQDVARAGGKKASSH